VVKSRKYETDSRDVGRQKPPLSLGGKYLYAAGWLIIIQAGYNSFFMEKKREEQFCNFRN